MYGMPRSARLRTIPRALCSHLPGPSHEAQGTLRCSLVLWVFPDLQVLVVNVFTFDSHYSVYITQRCPPRLQVYRRCSVVASIPRALCTTRLPEPVRSGPALGGRGHAAQCTVTGC